MASTRLRLTGVDPASGVSVAFARLMLYDDLGRVDVGASLSASHAPVEGALANLRDAGLCVFAAEHARSPGFYIEWVLGAATSVTRVDIGFADEARAVTQFLLSEGTAQKPVGIYEGGNGLTQLKDVDRDSCLAVLRFAPSGVTNDRPYAFSAVGGVAFEAGHLDGVMTLPVGAANVSGLNIASEAFAMRTADFTAEAWVKPMSGTGGDMAIFDHFNPATGFSGWQLGLSGSSGGLYFYESLPNKTHFTGTKSLKDGLWHHVALCRKGNTISAFVDGAVAGSSATSLDYAALTQPFAIGYQGYNAGGGTNYPFKGQIGGVRIYKGLALYVAAFNPPAIKFADAAKTSLPVKTMANAAARLVSEVPPPIQGLQVTSTQRSSKLLDVEFGGVGRIYGTVARKATPANTPISRRVRLHRSVDGYLARETWSKADGSYEFREISMRYEWDVIAWDHELQEYSTVANNQLAEVMP